MFVRSRLTAQLLDAKTILLASGAIIGSVVPGSAQVQADRAAEAVKTITVVTPHAPVARQIEPMVAPVRRVSPNAVAVSAAKSAVGAPAAKTAIPPPIAAASLAAPPAAPSTASTLKSAAGSTAAAAAVPVGRIATRAPAIMTPALAATGAPTPKPKFVAYTCKIGQDYSVERKTCFTPGVAKAATVEPAKRIAKAAPVTAVIDTIGRSSLGVKP